ncbi:MAG: hypothetical protein U0793_04115 [Gemmataceae bacterium]|mgnify:CR=1 FL=1
MIVPPHPSAFNPTPQATEDRWPRERYPALYMGAKEYAAHKARERKRRELLDLLGDDIIAVAVSVAKEALRGQE